MTRQTVEIQKELFDPGRSRFAKYCDLVVGRRSLWTVARYELIVTLCGSLPGALGLWLRAKLYPFLLGRCGRNVMFGCQVVLRHPHKVAIGDNVVIDDLCVLDAKGQSNQGIRIGSGVFVGRNTILSCKNGDIVLEDHANIGFNCEIFSASTVTVGAHTLIAAYAYLIGGDHEFQQIERPVLEQGRSSRGIAVGQGCWIGAGVKVLDGVSLGDRAIVGAGAVVTRSVPAYAIAVGIPAAVVRDRREDSRGDADRGPG